MNHFSHTVNSAASLLMAMIILNSCARQEDVRVYEVIVPPGIDAPAKPSDPMAARPAMGAAAASQAAAVKWPTPAGWQPQALTSFINRGHFLLPEAGGSRPALTISAYPEDAGGLTANVNRWRRQIGLPDDPAVAASMQQVTVAGRTIATCYFEGQKPDGTSAAIAGGVLSLPGETWFFKLTGTKDAVSASRPVFDAFLSSLSFP